ncbi:hypothetical protein [Asanoa iriomotensis]|uniref:Uncharacterized protein n=1 Tax=Asanoa iriomotensis TaxID=234613 RepID=A0ABQ4BWV0_9ACTN|nr:hypothetical protein [Asanoa iriomotensis]GIF55014.1 hypothetical protein Air01nite_11090 [Asanoa iriomotensis]
MAGKKLLAATMVAAMALAGCGKPFGGRVVYEGDYPSYETVADLMAKADLVIEATVAEPRVDVLYPSGDGGTDPRADPQAGAPEAAPPADSGIVITVWSAAVTRVHKGTPGLLVDVQQMGGERDGVVYEQPSAVHFEDGATYLLFLATFPDAPAALLNPYQAVYLVEQHGYRTLGDNRLRVSIADLEGR